MKKVIVLLSIGILTTLNLAAQIDTVKNQPNIKIKVNKETDESGNIIRFDSTYTYSYSGNDVRLGQLDSLFGSWNSNLFNQTFPFSPFGAFSNPDTTWNDPFYSSDFFDMNFFNDMGSLRERFNTTDSLWQSPFLINHLKEHLRKKHV